MWELLFLSSSAESHFTVSTLGQIPWSITATGASGLARAICDATVFLKAMMSFVTPKKLFSQYPFAKHRFIIYRYNISIILPIL